MDALLAVSASDDASMLARRLAKDLDGAFADLVRNYSAVLYSIARRSTSTPDDAADLAADAFLSAYRALRGYDTDRIASLQLRPWLVTIILNRTRNAARDNARAASRAGSLQTEHVRRRRVTRPELDDTIDREELERALATLSESQRTAVLLRHVIGCPVSEIAEVLRCGEATARSHVARGLRALRGFIELGEKER
jgi:RNA polymerase sigma factor (sigma-70 family)